MEFTIGSTSVIIFKETDNYDFLKVYINGKMAKVTPNLICSLDCKNIRQQTIKIVNKYTTDGGIDNLYDIMGLYEELQKEFKDIDKIDKIILKISRTYKEDYNIFQKLGPKKYEVFKDLKKSVGL